MAARKNSSSAQRSVPKNQPARLFLHKDVAFPKRAADFLADNDAAQSRGDNRVAFYSAQFISEPSTHLGGDFRVLQEQRTLKKLPAVQARAQNKMAVE